MPGLCPRAVLHAETKFTPHYFCGDAEGGRVLGDTHLVLRKFDFEIEIALPGALAAAGDLELGPQA